MPKTPTIDRDLRKLLRRYPGFTAEVEPNGKVSIVAAGGAKLRTGVRADRFHPYSLQKVEKWLRERTRPE